MRRQIEYVHPSQHTIQGTMRRYVNRMRTSESTYNTRYNEKDK